jgi:hypothetical protein
MVNEIRIYAEGGGNKADTKARFREGLSVFLGQLRTLARSKSIRWNIIACGGRDQAYQRFVNALQQHPGAFNVLLVDAEGTVAVPNAPWLHLSSRDGWTAEGASDENCHLMVQMMEAWFVADSASLAAYYGQGFNPNQIPGAANVETIPKDQLLPILESATRHTTKGVYGKISHGCQLLQRIAPAVVRGKAPHCDLLFKTLMEKMSP